MIPDQRYEIREKKLKEIPNLPNDLNYNYMEEFIDIYIFPKMIIDIVPRYYKITIRHILNNKKKPIVSVESGAVPGIKLFTIKDITVKVNFNYRCCCHVNILFKPNIMTKTQTYLR